MSLLQVLAVHRAAMKRSNARPTAPPPPSPPAWRAARHQVAPQLVGARSSRPWRRARWWPRGAQRNEQAVAEVEHVHQAEHQRQAGGDDEMIMPIASPATVSVSQVDWTSPRRAAPAQHGYQQQGFQSSSCGGFWFISGSLVILCGGSFQRAQHLGFDFCGVTAAGLQRTLQRFVLRPASAMSPGMHHAAIVHHGHGVAQGAWQWMFCSTSRMVTPLALSCWKASIMLLIITGPGPLLGSSMMSRSRGSTMARPPPASASARPSLPGRVVPELLQRRNRPKIHCSRAWSICLLRALRACQQGSPFTVRSEKMPMFSGT